MMMENFETKVYIAEGMTNNPDMRRGVRQRDTISAVFFNVILNGVVDAPDIRKDTMKNFI